MDRTHDISFTDYHLKDLRSFGHCLEEAANGAFPKGSSRYKEVHVLLLCWEDDNLGVIDEVLELRNVFRSTYSYEAEEWRIPSCSSFKALRKRLSRFLDDFEGRDSLLIVYYGGHGYMNDDRQCVWSCTGEAEAATIQWSGLQSTLEHAESDVLILLDCCAAASSISGSGTGVTELIAACGFETWAPGVGEHSFTRSLIDELHYWSRMRTLTAATLHQKVLSRIKYWKPRFGATSQREQRKTPVYTVLSSEGRQRSIELTPLQRPHVPIVELADSTVENSSSSSGTHSGSEERPSASSQTSVSEASTSELRDYPKVLISLSLEEDQWLHTDKWVEWIRSVPAVVKYASVDGVYKSGSSLFILALPVAIWNLLPKNPAVGVIGFVKSGNLLAKAQDISTIQNPQTVPAKFRKPTTAMKPRPRTPESRPDSFKTLVGDPIADEFNMPLPSSLEKLRGSTTVFLVDDSIPVELVWTRTAVILNACLKRLNSLTPRLNYKVSSCNSEVNWLDLPMHLTKFDYVQLHAVVKRHSEIIYRRLDRFLEGFMEGINDPGLDTRKKEPDVNLVVLSGSCPSRPMREATKLIRRLREISDEIEAVNYPGRCLNVRLVNTGLDSKLDDCFVSVKKGLGNDTKWVTVDTTKVTFPEVAGDICDRILLGDMETSKSQKNLIAEKNYADAQLASLREKLPNPPPDYNIPPIHNVHSEFPEAKIPGPVTPDKLDEDDLNSRMTTQPSFLSYMRSTVKSPRIEGSPVQSHDSTPSLQTNPSLLKLVEQTIRKVVLPEVEKLKEEQKMEKSRKESERNDTKQDQHDRTLTLPASSTRESSPLTISKAIDIAKKNVEVPRDVLEFLADEHTRIWAKRQGDPSYVMSGDEHKVMEHYSQNYRGDASNQTAIRHFMKEVNTSSSWQPADHKDIDPPFPRPMAQKDRRQERERIRGYHH